MATGILGAEKIVEAFKSSRVDIMILQESTPDLNLRLAAVSAGFAVNGTEQFWIASRFPIEEVHQPPKLQFEGRERSPRFIRYRISTPRGPLVLYNVHFISPRDGLDELRGQGFRYELLRGRLFSAAGRATLDANTKLRLAQMDAVRADAAGSAEPTIIAGDTNLPQLSWALADRFGAYTDGFTAVGRGFGYTFPAPKHPWMRIDRVLADRNFRFLNFKRIAVPLSDHYPVVADLEWRP
ncbi:MAG: endonuclease/exonuclease/phosphatase family protein [Pseudomonadota bacterium]